MIKDKLDVELVDWINKTFLQIFHYAPPPITDSKLINNRNILMFHEFNGRWYLAESNEVVGLLGNKVQKFETGEVYMCKYACAHFHQISILVILLPIYS